MIKREIKNKQDVILLVNLFYDRVRENDTIGPIFNKTIRDWDSHLPKMYSFWESQLLDNYSYKGNPLAVHQNLNNSITLETKHFKEWINLFNNTVDSNFKGPIAEKAKQRAQSILTVLEIKILHG